MGVKVDQEVAPGGNRQFLLDLRRVPVVGNAVGMDTLGDLAEKACPP